MSEPVLYLREYEALLSPARLRELYRDEEEERLRLSRERPFVAQCFIVRQTEPEALALRDTGRFGQLADRPRPRLERRLRFVA